MNRSPSIVSWHPVLTDHQSHTLRALQRAADAKLSVVIARTEDATRKTQGWTPADTGALELRLLGPGTCLADVRRTLDEHADSIHLFGSPFDHPRFMVALWLALHRGLPVYLISEPYSTNAAGYLDDDRRGLTWLKSKLRPWVYRFYGLLLRRRVRGVFAISRLAVRQYRALGLPAQRIHPFGYFVPSSGAARPESNRPSRAATSCRAIFVGNLIATKGLGELITSAKRVRAGGLDLQIDVYGAGDPAAFAFDGASVRYGGRIPFGSAQSVIADYDFLVLPSRYDGWGVVVNESLQSGVPVVCSDRVGAGAFVSEHHCGLVYDAASPDALDNALRAMVLDAGLRKRLREACRASSPLLEPAVAGRYMADVLMAHAASGPKVANPWYTC